MNRKFLASLVWLLICSSYIFAQNTYTISGTVKDQKETLPGAAIYISGYKISTVTNNEGKFSIPNLAPGNYDVLVQMIGYLPYSKNVVIADKSVNIEALLQENTVMLKEVVIKPDPNRMAHIALFKDFFIGKSPNAAQCKILNTNVLMINDDRENGMLTVRTNEFIVIENKALGYRLKYLLEYFEYNYKSKIIFYAGHPYFEEMKGGKSKQKKWQQARETAYNGSIQHFFKSLYHNTIAQDGFVINKLVAIPNANRKPDSLINANIKRLTTGQNGLTRALTFTSGDSLAYWLKQRREPLTMSVLSRADVLVDTLVKTYNNDIKTMNFKDELYVIYKNERETPEYDFSGNRQNRPLDMPNYQISIVSLLEPPVRFYANGGVVDPRSTLYKGFWAYEKVADLVPMDYISTVKK
ncbi:carboxypeptidase-like regulatory domain-containing protein [Pedobacter sp. ASV12]|uniref:carboxypeptidase-like regulatory domain-containing protein n=1 Tax=Pedobacter sp. ASV12 TaxID=2795120 RepID=UPI0018ED8FDA|nr:carboxypeptidase-like regulatory domain-containing protein [Pedobacter sp. ASV12]